MKLNKTLPLIRLDDCGDAWERETVISLAPPGKSYYNYYLLWVEMFTILFWLLLY